MSSDHTFSRSRDAVLDRDLDVITKISFYRWTRELSIDKYQCAVETVRCSVMSRDLEVVLVHFSSIRQRATYGMRSRKLSWFERIKRLPSKWTCSSWVSEYIRSSGCAATHWPMCPVLVILVEEPNTPPTILKKP